MPPVLHRCLLLLALAGATATAAVNPTVAATRSLGIVGPAGESTIAYDVNAAGQVAAVLEDGAGRQRGVLFEKGRLTELGAEKFAEWVKGEKRQSLFWLDPDANSPLIFKDLGVYGFTGSICEAM